MSSNSKKCKELVIRKKSGTNVCTPVFGIPQTCQLSVLGLILQDNGRFDCHVHVKLIKANKCLFILRTFARKFSNIDFFLKILQLKDDDLVMSEM